MQDKKDNDYATLIRDSKKIFDGLVHDIYRFENRIYKIPKDIFTEFHDERHFLVEQASLRLLKENGIPTPEVYEVIPKASTSIGKAIFIEEYVEGIQKAKVELTYEEQASIISLFHKAHKIRLRGYGTLTPNLVGQFLSWEEYLISLTRNACEYIEGKNIFKKGFITDLERTILERIKDIKYKTPGRFIFLDVNPGNIFFNTESKIINVIDIDHPISGDPVWYNPALFEAQKKNIGAIKPEKLDLYEIIHGLEVTRWMHSHKLDITEEIKRIEVLFK